jgi:hypothetical protein
MTSERWNGYDKKGGGSPARGNPTRGGNRLVIEPEGERTATPQRVDILSQEYIRKRLKEIVENKRHWRAAPKGGLRARRGRRQQYSWVGGMIRDQNLLGVFFLFCAHGWVGQAKLKYVSPFHISPDEPYAAGREKRERLK